MVKMCSRNSLFFILLLIGSTFFTVLSQDDDEAPDAPVADPVTEAETTVEETETTASAADGDGSTTVGTTSTGDETEGTGSDASPGASPGPTPTTATPGEAECVKNNSMITQQKRECRSSCSDTKKCRNVKAQCLCDGACGKSCIPPELKCRKPVDIEFGKVSILEGVHFDDAATYHCDEGYEIVGPEERTCQGDLKWSGEEPFCTQEGSRCKPPDFNIPNATLVVAEEKTEYYVGDYAVYECDEGFTPDGDVSQIECTSPKPKVAEWTPLNLTCVGNPCDELEEIQNGTISGENFTFGESATYECNPGYTMVGEPTRECQADGTWTGRAPECELPDVFCPIPEDPENGVVNFVPELYGHRVYYKCDPGYAINGTEFRQCISDGEWSDNDTLCSEIDCGLPEEPVNGSIIFISGTTWSKQVSYTCNDDTTAYGEEEIECQDDGMWSGPPLECLSHCIVTEIDHGFFVPAAVSDYARYNMIPTSALLPHDTKAQIACDEHYEMPSHEPVAQNHGDVQCNNGTWAPTNECVPSRCFCDDLKYDQLHERNLTLARDCVEPTAHNQEVPLKCEPEFPEMVKKGVLKCEVGEWKYPQDPDERCTKKSCSVQDIKLDNGKIYEDGEDWQLPVMDDPKVVPHGTELKFECTEEGYELYVGKNAVNPPSSNVNFTRECENGIWSARMPVCKPARCLCSNLTANLTDKGLETAECEELASSGDLVQLNCAANYSNPTGPLIAECQFGEWKPMDTECQKMCSCDELRSGLDPSLQVKECAGFIGSGTVLQVDCNRGYVNMTGTPDAECVVGEWMINETFCNATEDVPTAAPKDCKYHSESNQVQAFHQGKFLFNDSPVPHLGNVTLRCSNIQNLKFTGKRVLQCVDGKFNDAMPQCLGLIPDSPLSAPPLWLTTYPPEFHKTTEDGIVVVPRGSAVSITCWWSQSNPDVTVTGDVKPKSQKHATFNKISGYTTAFDAINEVSNIDYSCGIPGSEKGGKLTQFLKLKIADTCRMVENKVQQYGLLIDNQTRKYLYVEEDRVDLICGDLVKKGIQFMTCKRNGKWEWGPEEDCPEKTTEVPTTEATS